MIGNFTLITNTNLFTIFLALELQALVGYTLVREKKSFISTEAALKYFLIGSIASSFFIIGTALIYGQTGIIDYQNIWEINENNEIITLGITLIIIGLFFKIGAAPFHLWVPDVYAGASYETLLFISIFPKIFLFILIKSLQKILIINDLTIAIIILSLFIGSLQALKQQKIKKFISYTIIYNNGFFLSLTILPYYHSDYIQSLSLFFYLISSFLTLLLFKNYRSLNMNSSFQNIRDFLCLKDSNIWLLLPLTLGFFALIGIPPMSNFLFKTIIFSSLLDKGFWFITIILIFFSILPSFYYLRIISIFYFQPAIQRLFLVPINLTNSFIISFLTIVISISLLFLNELMHILSF